MDSPPSATTGNRAHGALQRDFCAHLRRKPLISQGKHCKPVGQPP
jgi:hypothetical protein